MFSSKNDAVKYIYIFCFALLLMLISLIFTNNFNRIGLFPNLSLIAIVYIAAYLDVYSGAISSYLLFYIYGSLTVLNPAAFSLAAVIAYAVSYILWRKVSTDNWLNEILITFSASAVYYFALFFIIFYSLGMHFNYRNFFFSHGFSVSIMTALISPLVFLFFKKIGYKNFSKRNRIIIN